ncbi:zinc finger protein 23 [Strongylocentrotus purpuratus]|uniref:C2H2-type domain-containing protein n=1 Tax=Strongylocentrotus purpuratus TaxID=7668 RepID=A0A7M7NB29_STRPU|nr:zinc finger protein 23 [Strongylocentrotus purpuratus]
MADKKTSLEVIKREIKEEPQSSEEPYKTYIVKEEDLEDDWTENDAKEVSEEPQSPDTAEKCLVEEDHLKGGQQGEEIQRRFHTDSVQEADSEDGWTEDDDAKEMEAQQSKEADHQTLTYFIKEEPVDSDSADDNEGTALQATSPSCSKQGGDSSLQSSYQSMRNTQEMSNDGPCDGARGPSLPEDFPLEAGRETQSDSSERESCPSEYDSCLIPSQVAYLHEKQAADGETPDATTSYHKHGGMDKNRNEDITMEFDETINQSSQLRATGSDRNDPSCSLAKEKPFLCCVCSKGFTVRSSLSRHMTIHGGEKPHECMFCTMRFMYIYSLKEHLRIHTGEKPYRCTVCDKGFRASRNLALHMKVHMGKNRF